MSSATGAQINEFAQLAQIWVRKAKPAELWEVLQHGGIDARVGMPGVMSGLGCLSGPASFELDLSARGWGPQPGVADLEAWFLSSEEAQESARHEMDAEITEMFFDLGDWEWSQSDRGKEAAQAP